MTTSLKEAMASGVFVEFFDEAGNTVGQAVLTDWNQPLPRVGDAFCCRASVARLGVRKLMGRVRARQFDIQLDEQGRTCVWVRLEIDAVRSASAATPQRAARFSAN